jgi:hypothetical protein
MKDIFSILSINRYTDDTYTFIDEYKPNVILIQNQYYLNDENLIESGWKKVHESETEYIYVNGLDYDDKVIVNKLLKPSDILEDRYSYTFNCNDLKISNIHLTGGIEDDKYFNVLKDFRDYQINELDIKNSESKLDIIAGEFYSNPEHFNMPMNLDNTLQNMYYSSTENFINYITSGHIPLIKNNYEYVHSNKNNEKIQTNHIYYNREKLFLLENKEIDNGIYAVFKSKNSLETYNDKYGNKLTIYNNKSIIEKSGIINYINGDVYEGNILFNKFENGNIIFIPNDKGIYYYNSLYHSIYGDFHLLDDIDYIYDVDTYNLLFDKDIFLNSYYIPKIVYNNVIVDKNYNFSTTYIDGYRHTFKDIQTYEDLSYVKKIKCQSRNKKHIHRYIENIKQTMTKINNNFNTIVDEMNLTIRNNLNSIDKDYILLYTNEGDILVNTYLSNNKKISEDILHHYRKNYMYDYRKHLINNKCFKEDTELFIKCYIETMIDGLLNNINKISKFVPDMDLVVYREIKQDVNIYKENDCITLLQFSSTSLNLRYVLFRIIQGRKENYILPDKYNTYNISFDSLNQLNIKEINSERYLLIIYLPKNTKYLPIFNYYGMNLESSEDEILLPCNINLHVLKVTDDNKIFCTAYM